MMGQQLSPLSGAAAGGRRVRVRLWAEGLSQAGRQAALPKHDALFTCQVVAFVLAAHRGRQSAPSFSSSLLQDHQ